MSKRSRREKKRANVGKPKQQHRAGGLFGERSYPDTLDGRHERLHSLYDNMKFYVEMFPDKIKGDMTFRLREKDIILSYMKEDGTSHICTIRANHNNSALEIRENNTAPYECRPITEIKEIIWALTRQNLEGITNIALKNIRASAPSPRSLAASYVLAFCGLSLLYAANANPRAHSTTTTQPTSAPAQATQPAEPGL